MPAHTTRAKRAHHSAAQWQAWLHEFAVSGLSQSEFCRRKVTVHSPAALCGRMFLGRVNSRRMNGYVVGGLLLPVVILLIVGVLLGGPHNPDTKIVIATFMRVLPLMLILFIASGVFAAVVAFEESYRKRTEAIINNTQA